jgi:hypothetical protein
MEALSIMLLLQLKHWYADFWSQNYRQTVCKGIYGDFVGLSHTLEHVIGTLISLLLVSFFMPITVSMILMLALLDLFIHYHVDYVKVHYGTKDNKTPRYWREFGLDQLAHQLTYLLIVYLIVI